MHGVDDSHLLCPLQPHGSLHPVRREARRRTLPDLPREHPRGRGDIRRLSGDRSGLGATDLSSGITLKKPPRFCINTPALPKTKLFKSSSKVVFPVQCWEHRVLL